MDQKNPTKEELRERLKAVKTRGYLSRLPQKLRDQKIETIKTNIDKQRNDFMEQLKSQLSPEQLQQDHRNWGLTDIQQKAALNTPLDPLKTRGATLGWGAAPPGRLHESS